MFKLNFFKKRFLKGKLSYLDGGTVMQVMKQESIDKSARSSQGYLRISGFAEESIAESGYENKTNLPKDLINLKEELTNEVPVTKPTLVDDQTKVETPKPLPSFRKGDILKHRSGGGPDIWYMGNGKGEFFTPDGSLGRLDVDDERFKTTSEFSLRVPEDPSVSATVNLEDPF